MIKFATRLKVTNSRNDDERYEWFFTENEHRMIGWIGEKEREQEEWNFHTPGAVSMRYYYFTRYTIEELFETRLEELSGITLKEIFMIFNILNKQNEIQNQI